MNGNINYGVQNDFISSKLPHGSTDIFEVYLQNDNLNKLINIIFLPRRNLRNRRKVQTLQSTICLGKLIYFKDMKTKTVMR